MNFNKEQALFYLKKAILVNFCFFLLLIPYFRNISKTFLVAGFSLWLLLAVLEGKQHFYRILFLPNYLTKPVLIFLFISLLAVAFSQDPYHSQKVFFSRHFFYLIFFLIGSGLAIGFKQGNSDFVQPSKNLALIAAVIIFSGIILGIGGVRDFFTFLPGRLFTVFGKEVPFSMLPVFFVFFIPFSVSFVLFSSGRFRNAAIVSLVLLIPCWVWTGSRAGWIAITISSLVTISLFLRGKKMLLALGGLILILATAFSFIAHQRVQDRLDNLFNREGFMSRKIIMEEAVNIFNQNRLLGAGIGMYGKNYQKSLPLKGNFLHAHNIYLEVLADSGIAGFLAFLFVFIVFFKKFFRAAKISFGVWRPIFIGLWGLITAVLVFELFNSSILVGMQFAPLFWFVIGIASAISSFDKQKNKVT